MEMTNNRFNMFKNIFPDYKLFKNWYASIPLSSGANDVPSEKTFTLIAFEFNDCHSNFSDESFRQRFANILYTSYREFEGTTLQIDKLMSMSDKDVSYGDVMTTNVASVPETESSTDEETVDFISTQQKTINRAGNLSVRKAQISNQRTYTVKTFLNRFRPLFVRVISQPFQSVYSEPDEL